MHTLVQNLYLDLALLITPIGLENSIPQPEQTTINVVCSLLEHSLEQYLTLSKACFGTQNSVPHFMQFNANRVLLRVPLSQSVDTLLFIVFPFLGNVRGNCPPLGYVFQNQTKLIDNLVGTTRIELAQPERLVYSERDSPTCPTAPYSVA